LADTLKVIEENNLRISSISEEDLRADAIP
jgi:hypothetical protein